MSTEATPTNTTQALKEETTPKTSSSDLKPILIPHSQEEAELIFERATYAGGIPLTRSPPTHMPEFAQTLPSHYLRTGLAFSFHDFLDVEESLSKTGSASGWALEDAPRVEDERGRSRYRAEDVGQEQEQETWEMEMD